MTPSMIENMNLQELINLIRTQSYHVHLHSAFILPILASKVETELTAIKAEYEKQIQILEQENIELEEENHHLELRDYR